MSRRCHYQSRMGSSAVDSILLVGCTSMVVAAAFFDSDTFCYCLVDNNQDCVCLQSYVHGLGDAAACAAAALGFDLLARLAECSP